MALGFDEADGGELSTGNSALLCASFELVGQDASWNCLDCQAKKMAEPEAMLLVAVEYLCLQVFPSLGAGARKWQYG